MKSRSTLLLLLLSLILAGCTTPPKPAAAVPDLTLEVLNPRTAKSPRDQFVTTIYLIRNTSQSQITITGGPKYTWVTANKGGGSKGPAVSVGPKAKSTFYHDGGYAYQEELQPGESFPFFSETFFGPDEDYPMRASFFHGDSMLVDDLATIEGFKYQAVFNVTYTKAPVLKRSGAIVSVPYPPETKRIELSSPWVAVEAKPVHLKAP